MVSVLLRQVINEQAKDITTEMFIAPTAGRTVSLHAEQLKAHQGLIRGLAPRLLRANFRDH